jgi:GNAT superfamily N-acetyltransferase
LTHIIRQAKQGDADFLAWAILSASRGHRARGWFDAVLTHSEEVRLNFLRRLTLTRATSWWHYSRFLVAESDGEAVAALSAFRAGDAYPLSQQAISEAAEGFHWSEAERQEMWRRGSYIFTCTLETKDDVWAIENIAVLPERRGRGLAHELIERAVDDGRRAGCRQAQITFTIGNDAAEHAYARSGFTPEDEKRHPDFEVATGAPGLRRYVRDL